jgi:hypothetical protein
MSTFSIRSFRPGGPGLRRGLHDPETATVVTAKKGEYIVTDGPFVETKEQIGGFWIIEVADLDAALELAKQASEACANPVEVRPFQGE